MDSTPNGNAVNASIVSSATSKTELETNIQLELAELRSSHQSLLISFQSLQDSHEKLINSLRLQAQVSSGKMRKQT